MLHVRGSPLPNARRNRQKFNRWQRERFPLRELIIDIATNASDCAVCDIMIVLPLALLHASLHNISVTTPKLMINIGTNSNPVRSTFHSPATGSSVVGVEPVPATFHAARRLNRDVIMVNAAVSNYTGSAVMHVLNKGLSSSLSAPAPEMDKIHKLNSVGDVTVPVITMSSLMEAIPASVEVTFLKSESGVA